MENVILMAGAGRAEITPSQDLLPMPLLYVLHFNRVIDPIYVRVLALSNGETQSLFIALEMTLVPNAEETMAFLTEQTGVSKEKIFLCATHTHGVTPLSLVEFKGKRKQAKCRAWYEQIKKAMLSAIQEAQANMEPARYGYGEGASYINVNRDLIIGEKAVLGHNFERPSDKTIRMVRVENLQGKTIAMIVNYACHAVVTNGCMQGLSSGITGDLPGRTCAKLESDPENGIVIWCSGAAGDQNPRLMAQQYVGKNQKGKPIRKNLGQAALTVLDYLSDEHARDILRTNEGIVCMETDAGLFGAELSAPVLTSEGETPYILRLWTLGNIAFQGISCEIVTTIGKAVRETSPYPHTILVSHTTDYQGYVADDWEYDHHSFEVGPTKVLKGAAQMAFVTGFKELFDAKNG